MEITYRKIPNMVIFVPRPLVAARNVTLVTRGGDFLE
jgi:hypothetical protein